VGHIFLGWATFGPLFRNKNGPLFCTKMALFCTKMAKNGTFLHILRGVGHLGHFFFYLYIEKLIIYKKLLEAQFVPALWPIFFHQIRRYEMRDA